MILFFEPSFAQQNEIAKKHIDSVLNSVTYFVESTPYEAFNVSKELYNQAQKCDYKIGSSYALYLMSLSVGNLKRHDDALRYANESKKIAYKIKNDSLLLYADFSIATQYGCIGLNNKSLNKLDDCIARVYFLPEDSRNVLLGKLYSKKAFFLLEAEESVYLKLHRKAAFYLEKTTRVSNFALNNIGHTYLMNGKLDSAEYYFKKSLINYHYNNNDNIEIVTSNLAEVFFKKKDFTNAIAYLDSSSVLAKQKKIYYLLAHNYSIYKQIYEAKGFKDELLKYQKLEIMYKDSTYIAEKNSLITAANYIVNDIEFQNEKKISFGKFLLIFGSLFIFTLILYSLTQFRSKNKLELDTQLKVEEIEQQSSEIVELKKKVSTSYDELVQMAKNDDPLFISLFMELYPCFYTKLITIQPKLTITEQKVCFYLKLKFSTKEIADYTFVTSKAIQNRKNRLRKRLGIDEGVDIYKWLEDLN